ncbi:MAG: c-type cytochrome [Rhodocyclaceae bacterium]|jgi:mono/diheme cytochrome c family protein|nr:MAG: c-type cytochrome [Rhodocyclaceae bacterium]
MSIARFLCLAALALPAISATPAVAADRVVGPMLGKAAPSELVTARSSSVYPDGRGLPQGRGDVESGRVVFKEKCASCHGPAGEGGPGGHLVGRGPLTGPDADKTVGNYWPFATTLFDFVYRAMPMNAPGSLTADETYAVTAFVLFLNSVVDGQRTLDARTLPQVRMPNRAGFVWIDAIGQPEP